VLLFYLGLCCVARGGMSIDTASAVSTPAHGPDVCRFEVCMCMCVCVCVCACVCA